MEAGSFDFPITTLRLGWRQNRIVRGTIPNSVVYAWRTRLRKKKLSRTHRHSMVDRRKTGKGPTIDAPGVSFLLSFVVRRNFFFSRRKKKGRRLKKTPQAFPVTSTNPPPAAGPSGPWLKRRVKRRTRRTRRQKWARWPC